jgi:hypothetical protein
MKTLRETRQIDKYLSNQMEPGAKLLFEAWLIIDPLLKLRVQCQRKLLSIIKQSGRRHLKSEIQRIHEQLFSDPIKARFKQDILDNF